MEHALLGAVVDLTDEAGDRTVKMFLVRDNLTSARTFGVGSVDGRRLDGPVRRAAARVPLRNW